MCLRSVYRLDGSASVRVRSLCVRVCVCFRRALSTHAVPSKAPAKKEKAAPVLCAACGCAVPEGQGRALAAGEAGLLAKAGGHSGSGSGSGERVGLLRAPLTLTSLVFRVG
jgi:hypothetical protein